VVGVGNSFGEDLFLFLPLTIPGPSSLPKAPVLTVEQVGVLDLGYEACNSGMS